VECRGPGSPVALQYTSWTDSRIVIDGFGPQYGSQYKVAPGDEASVVVQSTAGGGTSATWKGTIVDGAPPPLSPNGPTPQVAAVHFSRIGPNMHIEVLGAGFGPAPGSFPAVSTLYVFKMTDVSQGGWSAGGPGSPVALQYTSWTDSRIVIDGFGPQYGSQYKVTPGDVVSLFLQNSRGPEFTIWNGQMR
jgi:hypothetical protein